MSGCTFIDIHIFKAEVFSFKLTFKYNEDEIFNNRQHRNREKKLWHVQNGKCIEFNEYENVHKFFRRFFFHETSSKKSINLIKYSYIKKVGSEDVMC